MTQANQIELTKRALEKLFGRKRVVFWYDAEGAMRELYDSVEIDGVTKIEIENNEFAIKKRVVMDEPEQMFLIYAPYSQPDYKDNWLLDLVLGGELFAADASSLHLQEVGLKIEDKSFVDAHKFFFDSAERRAKFTKLIADSVANKELKAISIITGCEPDYDKVWYVLFAESLRDKNTKFNLITKANFVPVLWERAKREWGYESSEPSIKDLLVWFIDSCNKDSLGIAVEGLAPEAKLFLSRWRENIHGREVFNSWAEIIESETGAPDKLSSMDVSLLLDADIYASIDKVIIREILMHILGATMPIDTLQSWIEQRRIKYYFSRYETIYKALDSALKLIGRINAISFNSSLQTDVFKAYSDPNGWFEVDMYYRWYVLNSANYADLLKPLTDHIEKIYCNRYIAELSNLWQQKVDSVSKWSEVATWSIRQRDFYSHWIKKNYVGTGKRIFVIISDAFRYESAAELQSRIIAENRYEATLTPTLGVLPSYTQLGMAAMLPHKTLSYEEQSDTVYVDGASSQGTAARRKILQTAYAESTAMGAEDFLAINAKSGREDIKEYKVVYIYSNTIDKIGDDKMTENRVFQATEDEFERIKTIIKHIANMNGNNIIITSDHGYIYQQSKLANSDFSEFTPQGNIYKSNRRFVIGDSLSSDESVNRWNGEELGIGGDVDILTPKSINRIRMQGAGSRFVHGGSSLQEVVVPVLTINKKRKDTVEQVAIDVIGLPVGIKGNIQPISFYQQKVVGGKVTPRTIRAAFYTKDGVQISDSVNLIFDYQGEDSKRREQRYNFTFTPVASKYNNQMVELRLESSVNGTTQLSEYRKYEIKMMIAFSSEFDF